MQEDLIKLIIERIRRSGPIPFADFMGMALYEPGTGYYASPSIEIGREGDFYTSTHLHRLFGAIVARQAAEIWELLGRPADFVFLEQGPGRGLLALDVLDHARDRFPDFYDSITYLLIEKNHALRNRQMALLADHAGEGKTRWEESLGGIAPFTGFFFSNELVDSFPVHMVEFAEGGKILEIHVGEKNGRLIEMSLPCANEEILDFFRSRGIALPAGYRTEVNLEARRWLREAALVLSRGFLITVDYGYSQKDYFGPDRTTGTLLCYHRHQTNEEPLERVGRQDLTAHVNFSALVEWGRGEGFTPLGFTTQAAFLVGLGIDDLLAELHRDLPENDYLEQAAKVRGFLMPGAMGETHKVLIQTRNIQPPAPSLRGLSLRNRLGYLLS